MFNPGWHLSRDLKSMLLISEAVTKSAMARTESRGAHSRIDFPELDATWGQKHNIIVEEGGAMVRRESPIPPHAGRLERSSGAGMKRTSVRLVFAVNSETRTSDG